MQLSKTQISALLTEIASQEDGFNEILRMSFKFRIKVLARHTFCEIISTHFDYDNANHYHQDIQ
jgi:hypothetical protein